MLALIVGIILILIYFFAKEEKFSKKTICICLFLIFSLFAFRNIVGVDDNNYKLYYDLISSGNDLQFFNISGTEYSFYLFCKFFQLFGFNYKIIFFIYSLISFYYIYKTLSLCELTKEEYLILFLSFLSFSFVPYITIMRQFTATTIGIYAIYKYKKFDVRAFCLFAFAFFIHNSSIIFVPVYLFKNIKIFKNVNIYLLLPFICLFFNFSGLFIFLAKLLLKNSSYYRYIENIYNVGTGSGIVVFFLFAFYILSIILIKINKKEINLTIYLELVFFSLYFLTFKQGVINRLAYYFILFEPISILYIYRNINLTKKKCFLIFCILMFLLFISYNTIIRGNGNYSIVNYSVDFWRKT